ncbi:hypothetical protein [Hansschlegelia zhihuaiae]|uniref:hypothetical protein n=1 Tax=Hansschlegelia zhihuaiae TaxID=405005 RepID=UPI0019D4A843|nr:hypothetical protein [Hansschlegelia zhihuaiae]
MFDIVARDRPQAQPPSATTSTSGCWQHGGPRSHLTEVARKIVDLAVLRDELRGMVRQCGHGAVRDCRIIEVLSPQDGLPAKVG